MIPACLCSEPEHENRSGGDANPEQGRILVETVTDDDDIEGQLLPPSADTMDDDTLRLSPPSNNSNDYDVVYMFPRAWKERTASVDNTRGTTNGSNAESDSKGFFRSYCTIS